MYWIIISVSVLMSLTSIFFVIYIVKNEFKSNKNDYKWDKDLI